MDHTESMDQPFAAPDPSTQIPSSPPGLTSPPSGPRRGRMAVATVAAAGLIGVGVFGVAQLAGTDDAADDSASASGSGSAEPARLAAVADDATPGEDEAPGDGDPGDDDPDRVITGEIVIDVGDGSPLTIDLDDLDQEALDAFRECIGLPGDIRLPDAPFDLESGAFDDLLGGLDGLDGELDEWHDGWDELELPDLDGAFDGDLFIGPDGTHITVVGPDGVQIVDLGDGDASVTITQSDGELEITTDGDATITEPGDLLSDFMDGLPDFDGEFGDGLDLPGFFEDFPFDELSFDPDDLPDLADFEFPDIELPTADEIESCLDLLHTS